MTTSTSFAQMANKQSLSLSSALRANTPPTKGQTTSRKFLTLSIFLLLSFFCTTNAWGEDVTISVSSDAWTSTGTSGSGSTTKVSKSGVTVSSTKGFKDGTTAIREYSGGIITVSSSSNITKIVFTSTASGNSNYGPSKISINSGGGSYSYSGTAGTWTGSSTSIKFDCDAQFRWTKIVVTTKDADPYTVTFHTTATKEEEKEEASAGEGVTPPTMKKECGEWEFQGWSESSSNSEDSTTPLSLVTLKNGKYYPTEDIDLYPVYTKTTSTGGTTFDKYTKVDLGGTITSGKYLISTGSYTMAGNGKTGASFSPGTTEKTAYEYTVTVDGSYFTILGPDGKYVGGNDGTSLAFGTTISDTYRWKYVTSGIQNKSYTTRHIKAYGTSDFRHYATSNGTLTYLYKRTEKSSGATYYYSYPQCATQTTVTLNLDGGSFDSKPDGWEEDGNNYKKEGVTGAITLPTPTKTGYNFDGWYDDEIKVNNSSYTPSKTVTLVAKWTAKRTNISINANTANHGSGSGFSVVATYGEALPSFTACTPATGYELAGYYTSATGGTKVIGKDGKLVASVSGYTDANAKWINESASLTLHAQYSAKNYKVTFNANGGTGSMSTQTFTHGQEQALKANAFTRDHYTFNGWKDGNDNTYTDKQSITLTADLTLYAQWTANTYTITFNAGNGECGTESVTTTNAIGVTLPTASHTCTDWTFAGWAETSVTETTKAPTLLSKGDNYKPTADITLYAVYSKTETDEGGGTTPTEATLSFASTAQRTSFSSTQQVWEQNGIILTNNKSASTSSVADYSNPARFYASSEIIIEAPGNITQIVATCPETKYTTALVNSVGTGASSNNNVVTIIPAAPSTTYTIAKLTAQVQMSSLTVTYLAESGPTIIPTYNSNPTCDICENILIINKGAETNGTFTLDKVGEQETCDGLSVLVTPTPAEHYHVASVTASTSETAVNNGDGTYTITYAANSTGESTINVTFEEDAKASIILSELGEPTTDNTTYYVGETYTLPSTSSQSCEGKQLVGWSRVEVAETDTKPTENYYELGAEVTLETAQTFYAVFATAEGGVGGSVDYSSTHTSNIPINAGTAITNTNVIIESKEYAATKAGTGSASGSVDVTIPAGTTQLSFHMAGWNGEGGETITLTGATADPSSFQTIADAGVSGNGKYTLLGDVAQYAYSTTLTNITQETKITFANNGADQRFVIWGVNASTGGGTTTTYSDYTTTCDATKATVTYDLNGGTGATCEQTTVTKDVLFNLCSDAPTKEGYTFAGWSDGTTTYSAGALVTVSESTTFYASWKAKTITITWNLNYTGCPEAETSTYVYEGDEIEMPEDPIRTGYKFNGWYTKATDGTEVTEVGDENKPSADVTYYAQWEKLHTVTFIASGQVYVKQEHKYISGDKLVLPEIDPSAANFACDGYLFEGWSKYQQTKEDANRPELVDANTSVENDLELHAVWKKASTSGAGTQIFYESFDTENGKGANDDDWSNSVGANDLVNETWTFENGHGAYQCIKLGSASKKGSATTPALTQLSGDAKLSFKAAAWVNNNETTTLNLSISGGGTLTPTSVTMVKGAWTTYEVQIKDGTPSSTITFAAANAANNRFFLDEVMITTSGSYNYTTSPTCGPSMVAKEGMWVTSANGQSVKVNIPVGVKQFAGAATITGTSTNENFVVNTLENVSNGEHNLVVVYTPTADDTKENTTITLTAKNGEEVWSTTTFTLNGRSLPTEFVVVANRGDKNYALPANMTEANTYPGLEVEVTGNEVSAAPVSHLYTARAVHSTRFADNGTALRLVGNNDACLWASSAVSGTHIRNYAKEANATSANYEWNLYTEDGDTYYISSSAVTEEGRVLRLDGPTFGMYKQGVDAFRLLPVGCTSTPMNVKTSTTRISATISWNNAGACDLVIKLDETVVKNLPASVSPVVVSGLSESTAYTYTLTPVANASCAINGSFTTTGPTIDVVEWNAGGIRIYVDKDENVNPKVIINGEKEYGNVGGQLATELFFSKYYEAHAENKLLAVYNGTATTINLNGYVIKHGTVEIDLAQYGQTKGSIAPNEEIIFVSFDKDDTKSAESCAEKEEGFNTWNVLTTDQLAFSGRGSVGLYKNDVLIDLIGSVYPSGELTKIGKAGKPDYCGTEDDVQLHVDGVSVNDQSSFFCHNGDNIKTPEVETNYPISTNRCLLIRKNTVTSGATAVTSNKAEAGATCGDLSSTFTTLCTEWSGFRIGSGSSSDAEIQTATCEGLGYVGGFDYNNYYRTMENIYEGKTLDEYDYNEKDNTYFIEFEVPDYSCLNIQLQLTDNDGNVLTDQITQVPILVYDNKTTTNELFSAIVKDRENPDYENSKIRCATCDVVIQYGATLTKAAPGTANDVNQVRDIYVYPGGKLIIPEGADDYSVNSLSIRRDQDEVGAATIIAPLNITSSLDKPIYADVRINSENWHWFTLPYDCNIADVTWKNGSKAIYNSDWFLMTYNGEQRAATQSGGCWVSYEGTTIEAGKGYIIGITGHPTKSGVQYELRFPMAKEVLTKESDPAGKQVAVNAWGVKENIRPNHKGWNLVGNPYLDSYQPTTSGFKGLSLLKYTEVDPVTGEWYYDKSGTIPYLVTPINGGWYAYEQELASETKMKPLTAYFVQVGDPNNDDHENGEELYANFTPSSRANLPKSIIRRAPSEVNETEEPVIVGVSLTNAQGESDKTSLVIADRFTNEYEMQADFFKWFGDYYKYYTKPVLYTIGADQGKRAFNALNEQLATQPIPMGMFAAKAGNYTFSLNQQFDLSRVEEVWLYDATQSTYTNLMQSDYTFSTSKVNGAGRFSLSVKLAPKVATSIDNVTADKVWATTHTKQVIVNGLESGMHLWLYDATGKLLYTEPTSNYQHTYAVPQTGTYFVSVMKGNAKQTIKVVVE